MFYKVEKLSARVNELSKYRYRDSIAINEILMLCGGDGVADKCLPDAGDWTVFKKGDVWEAHDMYAWLCADVEIPISWDKNKIVGQFRFSTLQEPFEQVFEALLYVNGTPFCGVDTNHTEIILPSDVAGTVVNLKFRLWSGLRGIKHELAVCCISRLDAPSDDLYFTGKAVIETIKILPENSGERAELLSALEEAFLAVDWSKPGSECFYQSVEQARSVLHDGISKIPKQSRVTVYLAAQTHIDAAWLWRLEHTREKTARSFTTALRLMELYPELTFFQTQPQLYEYLKDDYPDVYERIRASADEGRWETDGAMWLEADCNIPSGESLVRQILFGVRFFEKEFGRKCACLWLPDVFGYSWALPQILKKSGIDVFMTTKMGWNSYNRFPHDTFLWRGLDGSEVLTYLIVETKGLNPGEALEVTAAKVQGAWDTYRDKELNQEILSLIGYGDGGGGINREMLEMRRRLNEMPAMPNVTVGRVDDYFNRLRSRLDNSRQYIHTWDGELYLEFHRGTYTSQAFIKRENRRAERLYMETELFCIFSGVLSGGLDNYPQDVLNEGWKIILRNQFHDIIPGTSIAEVYADSRNEYEKAHELANSIGEDALSAILDNGAKSLMTVFNCFPWRRTGLVRVKSEPDNVNIRWFDNDGKELKSQFSGSEWHINVENVPSMGFADINFQSDNAVNESVSPFTILDSGIVTPYYKIDWNSFGQLTRIYDKCAVREVLAGLGNALQVFEDKPLSWNAWDIEIYYRDKMESVSDIKSISIVENGPVRAVIRFEWTYRDSFISQDMVLYAECRRIDFETRIDWREHEKLLKTAFPVDIRSTEATYDIQFGNIKRPTHWNTSWDYARFEVVGHMWADLSENGYGVSLLNDCKYGYDIKDNVVRLSLIKSGIFPDKEADQGFHGFIYSLLPHKGDWLEETVRQACALNHPMTVKTGKISDSPFSLLSVSESSIMIDAVKKAEDSDFVILRLHEFSGRRHSSVKISSDIPIKRWQECDLMERETGGIYKGPDIEFAIKPYEIKTFIVSWRD